jgi:hypothetical protein
MNIMMSAKYGTDSIESNATAVASRKLHTVAIATINDTATQHVAVVV